MASQKNSGVAPEEDRPLVDAKWGKAPEVVYIETRAMKLLYQQVFQYLHEENLTLFEDTVVTAQAASLFLE